MNKKKRIIIIVSILSVLAIALGIMIASASVRNNFDSGEYGACLSIAFFEKWKMDDVDKVVIVKGRGKGIRRIEITDQELINDIVEETAVATHADVNVHGDSFFIELYCGDKMIRSMPWASYCCGSKKVAVYESGLTHWLFRPLGDGPAKVGYVQLSEELVATLMALE